MPIPDHLISAENQSHSNRGIKWHLGEHWIVHTQHPWHPQDCLQRSPHYASLLLISYDDVPMSYTLLHLFSVHWRHPAVYPVSRLEVEIHEYVFPSNMCQ